jgi:glutathione synthase
MRILVIADPLASFKPYKDSTFAMMLEAERRGHALYFCEQHALGSRGGRVRARVAPLALVDASGERAVWWSLGAEHDEALADFDAVLMRKDPPFDMEYVASTWLLEQAGREGARVFNDPRAVRNHNEKLAILEFARFTAPTIVTRSADDLRAFVMEHREAVFKLLDGMGGMSVFRARADDPNLSVIIETMNRFGERTVMAQRFIPAISEGDKRVLLIGGKVVPYCLARIPQAGEFRGNLAAGGRGVARALSDRDREIAQTLAPILFSRGLLLVGLDVIGDNLTEINVTSPTCFREITAQTGFDVAALFVDSLERAVSGEAGAAGSGSAARGLTS